MIFLQACQEIKRRSTGQEWDSLCRGVPSATVLHGVFRRACNGMRYALTCGIIAIKPEDVP